MRRQPAHGVKGDGAGLRGRVNFAPSISPRDRHLKRLLESGVPHLVRQRNDARCINAGDARRPLGCAGRYAVAQQLEGGRDFRAICQLVMPLQRWVAAVRNALRVGIQDLARGFAPHQLVVRIAAIARQTTFRIRIKRKQALTIAVIQHHKLWRIGEALQESVVDLIGLNQHMQERHQQRAIGAGLDRNPLISNGGVARAHWIDRNESAAITLELADGDLHRIAVVVFGRTHHHEELGAIQIWPAKFPKTATHCIDHARRHVDRAEAPMRRVVGRAELAGEQASERLHLVAPSEEGKLLGVGRADFAKALGQDVEDFVPRDRLKLARATFAAGLAHQWLRQARGGDLLHDA